MNGRSTIVTFFIFLLLIIMVSLQFLSMLQSDRLYDRLNQLMNVLESGNISPPVSQQNSNPDTENENKGDNGDWLVVQVPAEPKTLNVLSDEGDTYTNAVVLRNIVETLFYYDLDEPGVKLKPVLAESLDVSSDGLEMTVRLKENIYFSDGVPITADDVIFTYETIMNPGVDAASIRNYFANIKEVKKIDQRTVKFVFNEIYWKTLESVGIFEVLPKHIYQFKDPEIFNKMRSNPVGSGPYIFEKWDIGREVVLRRNENYWGQKPKIKKLVFRFITNPTASLQAMRKGDIDEMEPTAEQFTEMEKDQQFKEKTRMLKYSVPTRGFYYMGWNQAKPFFKDKNVRLAMTMIINRQSIVENLLKNIGQVTSGPFYPLGKQPDPNIKPWPYDPEQAKKLLDQAGWIDHDGDGIRDKDGIAFRFKFSYGSGSSMGERLSKIFKDEAARIGVVVVPDPIEWSIFQSRVKEHDFDSMTAGWGGTIEQDPYQLFHSSQIKGGSNYVGFSNPKADALMEKARKTLNENERYELYHQFHRLLHEEQPYTFLVAPMQLDFIDKRFENVKVHKHGIDSFEWYVPKDKQKYK